MSQSKFSLADVFTVLSALIFGFFCFLGLNFYLLGNLFNSITFAVLITTFLFSTAFITKRLKQISVKFKTAIILETLLFFLFTLSFAVFSYLPFSHFFTVSDKNTQIVDALQKSINQAENNFPAYETYVEKRKKMYESTLKSEVESKSFNPTKYNEFGFVNDMNDLTQINKKIENISDDMFPTNYSDAITEQGIKEVASNWLLEAKKNTESWKQIGITNVVMTIDTKTNAWKDRLVNLSKKREAGEESEDFKYELAFDDIKQHFTTVEKPSKKAIIVAGLLWFLMLLSWFKTNRSTKWPGFKLLFATSQTTNNEL